MKMRKLVQMEIALEVNTASTTPSRIRQFKPQKRGPLENNIPDIPMKEFAAIASSIVRMAGRSYSAA